MTVGRNLELRCFCRRRTLLAVCGRNPETGHLFVHVKHRHGSATAEEIVESGVVRLKCHVCNRWHTVRMREETYDFVEQPLPPELISGKR